MNTPLEVREYLLERLGRDLIGPIDPAQPAEVLHDNPTDKYLTGILYPRQTRISEAEDDELPAADDDAGGGEETAVPLAQCKRPASAGLSFTVRRTDGSATPPQLLIAVTAARYEKRWISETDGQSLTDKERKGRDHVRWLRVPPPPVTVTLDLGFTEPHEEPLDSLGLPGLRLYAQIGLAENGTGVTVVLINAHEDAQDRDTNEHHSWFQTGLAVCPGKGCAFVGRPLRREAVTRDDQTAALIYRDFLEFAVGHTCSASWDADGSAVAAVRTEWLPRRSVDAVSADGDKVFDPVRTHASLKPFSAAWLADAKRDELLAALALVPGAYHQWMLAESARIPPLNATLQAYAREHERIWTVVRDRMLAAIQLLHDDDHARSAFQLANRAMALQRLWSRGDDLKWRPFQVAFQLLVLESVLNPKHADRDVMDLLWFPTGGGKTEAYLAVIALVLFYRRLSRKQPDGGAGVNVIMRYTLRVLTTQQFQRAAYLICACEKIRVERKLEAGAKPFSIGLWVGSTAIPNKVAEAHADAQRRAMQVKHCPCCGKKVTLLTADQSRYAIACVEPSCHFGKSGLPLPIWTVDEDVYRELPSLLIGTIDKFAQIARNPATGRLFGIATTCAPPDLIIQDELHLISGPLGTIAGLYEIAIDAFCSANGSVPKVIGSTATIKMADEQVLALFNRTVLQFPPPGLDASNSCFAVRDDQKPGRLYLGVTTAGRSAKFTLQAVCATLLQSAFAPAVPAALRDAYWTLVAYFNALRELGGAHVLMLDDVPKSIGEYAGRRGEPVRKIAEPAELTSRLSQADIPDVLKRLENSQATGDAEDALLSTNMISVGVDIPRLALMVVNGQPKAISEYIQATSRVGRDVAPGLVVTVFNNAKPRDRSHYETFSTWHSTLYRDVEATSVTPFAPRAVDKALRAVLVAMVRHLVPNMRTTPVLNATRRLAAERMRDLIVARVAAVDPDERTSVEARLNIILDEWEARTPLTDYWNEHKPAGTLLMSAERIAALRAANRSTGAAWSAPNSMREVEPGTHFRLH
ncbi:MAG: hypothetical protein RIS76_4260 [Verrucomicrobiota bacterium]|jgi:hypothetical protein